MAMARVVAPDAGKIVEVDETHCWVKFDQATSRKSNAWNTHHEQGWHGYRLDNLRELMPHPSDVPDADGRRRRSRG